MNLKPVKILNLWLEIRPKTHCKFDSDEKIRIILEGLKGEDSITAICFHLKL